MAFLSNCTIPIKTLSTLFQALFSPFRLCMLTIEKLTILLKFNWDADQFGWSGSPTEKKLMVDIDWSKYASLLQDLMLVSKKLVSTEFARAVHRRLLAACADEATAQTFIGYASTL